MPKSKVLLPEINLKGTLATLELKNVLKSNCGRKQ